MEIVKDIHGNQLQMVRGNKPIYPYGIKVKFKSNHFAQQFIEWLEMPPDFWYRHFNIEAGPDTSKKIAQQVLRGHITFVKLPQNFPLLG